MTRFILSYETITSVIDGERTNIAIHPRIGVQNLNGTIGIYWPEDSRYILMGFFFKGYSH